MTIKVMKGEGSPVRAVCLGLIPVFRVNSRVILVRNPAVWLILLSACSAVASEGQSITTVWPVSIILLGDRYTCMREQLAQSHYMNV